MEQVLHIGAIPRMHRNALAASHVADDLFTANRIATSRAIDQQIVLPLYLERIRPVARSRACTASETVGLAVRIPTHRPQAARSLPGDSLFNTCRAEYFPKPIVASRSFGVATP